MKPVKRLFATGIFISVVGGILRGLTIITRDLPVWAEFLILGVQLTGAIVTLVAAFRAVGNLDLLTEAHERHMREKWGTSTTNGDHASASRPTEDSASPSPAPATGELMNATYEQREALKRIKDWYNS